MKLRIMIEATHNGAKTRQLRTIEVPEKTVRLHSLLAESGNSESLTERVVSDVMSNVYSSVAGPAAQSLDPMSSVSSAGPSHKGAPKTAADTQMEKMLGFDLVEAFDRSDRGHQGPKRT
jgi:hypothetical protein